MTETIQLGDVHIAVPRKAVMDAWHRALMTGFGNARLQRRDAVRLDDLPKSAGKKGSMGFLQ